MMIYIESPEKYKKKSKQKSVFLAGGITNCPDWQSEIVALLNSYDIAILNPRRKNFPIDDPNVSKEQIRWEFQHLRNSDIIIFWFPKESICPIALYELGAWCMTDRPICIGVDKRYKRKVDVEQQTLLVRPEIEIVYSLEDLTKKLLNLIHQD